MKNTLPTSIPWQRVRLGELFRVKHGYAFKGEYFSDQGDEIVLTPGNFGEDGGLKFKGDKEKYYSGEYPEEFRLKAGDFLVVMTDLTQEAKILGSAAFVPSGLHVLHNQRLGKIIDIDEARTSPRYVYYLFNSPCIRAQLKATASGATVKHTSPSRIAEATVLLPPLDVQRRIAGILLAYDDLIEVNTRRIAILEEMARRLFEEWFVRFRYPGHEVADLIESENGREPAGWAMRPFSDAVQVLSGGTPRKAERAFWDGHIAFFTPSDAKQSAFAIETGDRITEAGLAKCASKLFDAWTVFITARGTVGRVLFAAEPMAINQSCYALRGKDGYPQTFVYGLASQAATAFRQMAHGAVFDTIVKDTFDKYEVVLPPAFIAQQYDQLARPLYESILVNLRQNFLLRAARDLLLPKLISGEIDLSSAEGKVERAAKRAAAE